MKFKKVFSFFLAASLLSLTSCKDDDDNNNANQENPGVAVGAIVVCNGQMYDAIPGSITSYDIASQDATLSAFKAVNGRNLGDANDAVFAGNYLFVASSEENTVEVLNRNTLKSVKTIRMVETFGADKGNKPRCLYVNKDVLYISTFAGYVCTLDVKTLEAGTTYKVGSYPEGITASADGSKIYVANSDYGKGVNPSVSVIDLSTKVVFEIKSSKIQNPRYLMTSAGSVYLVDLGSYDESWNQTGAALYKLVGPSTFTKVCDATMAAASDSKIFYCNAPFHTPVLAPTYGVYDTTNGFNKPLDISVEMPACVGIDPATNNFYVGSYTTDPATGYAYFSKNGYVEIFDNEASIGKFSCGVGPMGITFNVVK